MSDVKSNLLQSIWSTVSSKKREAVLEGFSLAETLAFEGSLLFYDDEECEAFLSFSKAILYYYKKTLNTKEPFDLPELQAGILNYFSAICGSVYALGVVSYAKGDVEWTHNIADLQKTMLTKASKRSARSANLECVFENTPLEEIPSYVVDVMLDAFAVIG